MPPKKASAAPREWQADSPLDPAAWVSLADLALHGFGHAQTIDQRIHNLTGDLADEVIFDDIGRPTVARDVARRMFTERAQKRLEEQARDRANQQKLALAVQPLHDHVRALQRRQLACESSGSALGDMMRGEFEKHWDDAAAKRDEINAGGLVYHSITDGQG